MSPARELSYSLAINEALHQCMAADRSVFLIGQGVKSPWYVGNTARDLLKRFGEKRVIDTPVSENAVTGAAVGAALAGMRAVVVHPRVDFMLYALDPVINEAANWHYMSGGRASVPVVIWGIINRGGEQAAQHSQSLHATFAHIPGLKVVMPATPYDAKGLMAAAIREPNPVVFLDDRWLYGDKAPVPEQLYEVQIGKAALRRRGRDLSIIASSYLAREAVKAAAELEKRGVDAEVLDLRTVKPLDAAAIVATARRTGRVLIADGGWRTCGVSAEVAALVAESGAPLKAPVCRLTLPDCPAPASQSLEKAYYLHAEHIVSAASALLGRKAAALR